MLSLRFPVTCGGHTRNKAASSLIYNSKCLFMNPIAVSSNAKVD